MELELIKEILLQENVRMWAAMKSRAFGECSELHCEYAKNTLADEIKSFSSIKEIDEFIYLTRRTSLQEWVDSL